MDMGANSSQSRYRGRGRGVEHNQSKHRVILVGDKCTGKTAIIHQLDHRKLPEAYEPTHQYGVDEIARIPGHPVLPFWYYTCRKVDDGEFCLTLRDTCERDSLSSLWQAEIDSTFGIFGPFSSARDSEREKRLCCVIVYSVTDRESFEGGAKRRVREARRLGVKNILLLGNKCDCVGERQVGYFEAKEFSIENDMSFFEVSAKDGSNVEVAFMSFFSNKLQWKIYVEPDRWDF